jgi:hypothetical protein
MSDLQCAPSRNEPAPAPAQTTINNTTINNTMICNQNQFYLDPRQFTGIEHKYALNLLSANVKPMLHITNVTAFNVFVQAKIMRDVAPLIGTQCADLTQEDLDVLGETSQSDSGSDYDTDDDSLLLSADAWLSI